MAPPFKYKEPPCVIGLQNIANHMGWTIKRVMWWREKYHFPIRPRFDARGMRWVLYLAELEHWKRAEDKAAEKYLASKPGYHARNYSKGKRDRLAKYALV